VAWSFHGSQKAYWRPRHPTDLAFLFALLPGYNLAIFLPGVDEIQYPQGEIVRSSSGCFERPAIFTGRVACVNLKSSIGGIMISLIPSPAVSLVNGRPAVTSLQIAEHFGKTHDRVLKDIRRIASETPAEFSAVNFDGAEYVDEQGKPRPMFTVYRDGFMLLVMGYTGSKSLQIKLAYIQAFNAMEKALLDKPAPKALPKPTKKTLSIDRDSPQSKVNTLLGKVRFYINEISDTQKQVNSIMTAEYLGSIPGGKPDFQSTSHSLYSNLACETAALWTSINFALRAVEDSIRLQIENSL
jgi:Rha family phage regulatory protein